MTQNALQFKYVFYFWVSHKVVLYLNFQNKFTKLLWGNSAIAHHLLIFKLKFLKFHTQQSSNLNWWLVYLLLTELISDETIAYLKLVLKISLSSRS